MSNDNLQNAFAIFDIPQIYRVNLEDLEDRYLKLSQLFHPDRFATKTDTEKLAAANKSIEILQAYETLKDPLKRASLLLELEGVPANADITEQDPEILMQTMQDHERLDSLKSQPEAIAFVAAAQTRLTQAEVEFEKELAANPSIRALNRLRYAVKTVARAKNKQKEIRKAS